ncbi:MAG: toprim domain-containing protein, partial [Acetobacteraceae bacterium]
QPKYLNGPETALFVKRRTLYGIDLAARNVRSGAELLVVEGYLDVIALHQAGFGGAVAPLGTALTAEHLAELWRLAPSPVLCFDGDAAGARAALRTADLALPLIGARQTLSVALLPQGEDPDTLVRRRGPEGVKAVLNRRRGLADALFDATAGDPGPTPEERAAMRRRLEELADRIADRALREEYRRHFRDRWFASVRAVRLGGRPVGSSGGRPPRPALAPSRARALREREVLALLLAHPALLPEAEEPLATERFACPPCEQIRAALVAEAEALAGLDPARLLDHLRDLGLSEALEAVLGRSLSDIPPTMLEGAAPEEVRAVLALAFGRLDPDRLEREVAEARARLALDFSDANVRRVTRLIDARDRLLGEAEGATP